MKQITKRWLSLLLAAALCVTAGGIPALAAEDEDTGSPAETTATGGGNAEESGGTDNGAITLPAGDEEQPVVSVDVPDAGEDSGNTAETEPENPETPSEDEQQPAEETTPQDGESGSSAPTLTEPEQIPEGFFQSVEVGKAYKDGKITEFGSDVDWNSSCAVLFRYKVPKDMTVGTKYTFRVDAPLEMGVDFTIRNDKDEPIADGVIGTDGESYLVFRDGAQDYAKAGVEGYFYVGTKFKESAIGSGGKKNIEIKIDGTTVEWSHEVDFVLPKVETGVSLNKSAQTDGTLLDNHQVEWTITATPWVKNADHITSLTITDSLEKLLDAEKGIDLVRDSENNQPIITAVMSDGTSAGTVTYDETEKRITFTANETACKTATWKLPITIKFRTTYDPSKMTPNNEGKLVFSNTADAEVTAPQWTQNGSEDPKLDEENVIRGEATNTAWASVSYASIAKKGVLIKGDQAQWTVTVKNSLKQPKPQVEDVLPEHMELTGDVWLEVDSKAEDGTVSTTRRKLTKGDTVTDTTYTCVENESHHWVLKAKLQEGTTENQRLIYTTVFDSHEDVAKMFEVRNYANLYVDDKKVGSASDNVHIGKALMTKSGSYDKTKHTITWTVELSLKDMGLDQVTLIDTFGQSPKQSYVADSLAMKVGDKEISPAPTPELTYDENHAETGFKLLINNDHHTDKITLTYQTRLLDSEKEYWGSNKGGFTISNSLKLIAVSGMPAAAEISGSAGGTSTMLKKEFSSYNAKTHEITWKLTVNQNQMALTGATIEDVLPNTDWAFVQDEGSIRPSSVTAEFGTTEDGNPKMTLHLPEMKAGDKPLEIFYKTRLAKTDLLQSNQQIKTSNTATLYGDQIPKSGVSSSAAANVGSNVLDKTTDGKLDENLQLTWQVDVNSNLATITAPNGGQLGIEDVLQNGLRYVDGSMKVCNLTIEENGTRTAGTELELNKDYTVEYNAKTRQLVIRWNKGTIDSAYRLTFQTRVLVSGKYSNTVKFVGFGEGGSLDASKHLEWVAYSGGFTKLPQGMGGLEIIKTDSISKQPLEGVKFRLTDSTTNEVLGVFTTDKNGKIDAIIPEGRWEIEEIETLPGYVLPDACKWTKTIENGKKVTLEVQNTKNSSATTFRPEVTKEITGEDVPADQTFRFEIAADTETPDAPLPKNTIASVKGEGTTNFDPIKFTAEGTYKYTITEKNDGASGFTYDIAKHTMTVTVGTADGALKVTSVKYDEDKDGLTITNSYKKPQHSSGGGGGGGSTKPDPKPDPDPDKPVEPTDPDTPTTPTEPDQPTTPTTPTTPSNPSKPTPPTYPIDRVPDPNEPNAPDPIIVIDDNDVPLGEFHREEQPDGTFIYVDDDDIPLGVRLEEIKDETPTGGSQQTTTSSVPQTGTPWSIPMLLLIALLFAGGTVLFGCLEKKARREEKK